MKFSFLNYGKKRTFIVGFLSLIVGYSLGITAIHRELLVHYLVPSSLRFDVTSGVLVVAIDPGTEKSAMIVVNSLILMGSSIGSLIVIIATDYLGKVRTLFSALVFFSVGSILNMRRSLLVFSVGRFICGIGIGISIILVPSYIKDLTNRQNQNLFLALHKVMFCCGILLSYLLSNIIPSVTKHIIKDCIDINFSYEVLNVLQKYQAELLSNECSNNTEILIKLYRYNLFLTTSIRILFSIPLLISLSLLIIHLFKKFDETPLYHIKMKDISAAEEIVREVYGVNDTRKIMNYLIEESENDLKKYCLSQILNEPSLRMTLIFTIIVIFTGVSTGFIPLIMNSKILTKHLNIGHDLSAIIIALNGCFLVIFTFSGIFFEVHIGCKKLLLFGLILNLSSLILICFLLYYYNNDTVINKIVPMAFVIATASYGFGVIPTMPKIVSNNLSSLSYSKVVPFILAVLWVVITSFIVLIELLPIPVMVFIYTFLTFFSLVSISIINYQYIRCSNRIQILKNPHIIT